MATSTFLVAALCLLSLYSANAFFLRSEPVKTMKVEAFTWKDCGPSSDPAQIQALTVAPDPLKFPGNITISTTFNLAITSPADVDLELTLEKKIAGFFVKVPCIDNVGSCTYKGVCADWAKVCPTLPPLGVPCICPFPARGYSINGVTVEVKQSIPGIAAGDFRVTGKLSSASGEVVCLEVTVTLS